MRLNKRISLFFVIICVDFLRQEVQNAADEIGDHESNDDESEYVVHVQDEVLLDDGLCIAVLILKRLKHLAEPLNINKLDEPGQSRESKKFHGDTCAEEQVKREDGDEVYHEPTRHVVEGDLLDLPDVLVGIWIFVFLQEIKNEVSVEEIFNQVVEDDLQLVGREGKRNEEQRCEARVSHQNQYPNVEERLPLRVSWDYYHVHEVGLALVL